jgi:hypothetical protein
LNVSYVQEVKTSVRKNNTFPLLATVLQGDGELATLQDFTLSKSTPSAQCGA